MVAPTSDESLHEIGQMFSRVNKYPRWRRFIVLVIFLGLLLINNVVYVHSRAALVFASHKPPSPSLERMSLVEKARTLFVGATIPRPTNTHSPSDIGLMYQTQRIAIDAERYLEAWLIPHHQARGVVLLFHGYADSKESLLAPAATFYALGYTTLLVDFQGSGGSSGHDTTIGIREALDVQRTFDYVRQHWPEQPIVLYGFSMGAVAVMRAIAHNGVQPAATILEAPFDRLINAVRNRLRILGLPEFPGSELVVFWGSIQQGVNGFAHNPVEDALAIRCPTLVIHGQEDQRVTNTQIQVLVQQLQGRHMFVNLPEVEHRLSSVAAPEQWRQAVISFLAYTPAPAKNR